MTLTFYRDYQELFNGCVYYSDGSLTSDGKLANIINAASWNGTLKGTGEPTSVSNRFGLVRGLSFDGTNDYISLVESGTPPIGNLVNACTIIAMVYATVTDARYLYIESLTTGYPCWGFGIYNNAPYIWGRGNSNTEFVSTNSGTPFFPQNTYSGIGFTKSSGNTIRFFANDTFVNSTQTLESTSNANRAEIGNAHWGANARTYFYPGILDALLIFNTVKTDAEITTIRKLLEKKYLYPVIPGQRGVE